MDLQHQGKRPTVYPVDLKVPLEEDHSPLVLEGDEPDLLGALHEVWEPGEEALPPIPLEVAHESPVHQHGEARGVHEEGGEAFQALLQEGEEARLPHLRQRGQEVSGGGRRVQAFR